MNDTDLIRPLKDVWLRPRRVFRELGKSPIGPTDYVLAAMQGVGNTLFATQLQLSGVAGTAQDVVLRSLLMAPLFGILGIWLFTLLYSRLLSRDGTPASRPQVFHVMAYGSVPMALCALLWGVLFAVLGDAALPEGPGRHPDSFAVMLVWALRLFSGFLLLWSYLLQIMGLSEISNERLRRSAFLWAIGQVVGVVIVLLVTLILAPFAPDLASPG